MESIHIGQNNGIRIIADKVEVLGKEARLTIRVAHKDFGEPLDKITSLELAKEIAEFLIQRESNGKAIVLDVRL